jgi:glycosyltransferase involved in cell wall biosynthesis
MNNKSTIATIAIITCKRPSWLKRLLQSLSEQIVTPETVLDILVVDNACDIDTENVVNEIKETSPFPINYQIEPIKGIVAARNKCVNLFLDTESEFLIFIDDDEWPANNNWASLLIHKQHNYKADIVTSHVVSVGEEGTPSWAIDLIYGKNSLTEGEQITKYYTNNLLIKRNVLEKITPAFDTRFAMTGASDYHFALKCTKAGFKAFYTDAPVIEEFPKSRAKVKWFLRRGFRSGIGYTRSHLFEDAHSTAITKGISMAAVRCLRGLFYCLKGIITLNKTTFVDGLFRLCSSAGTLAGFVGIKHNEYNKIHGK